MVQLPWSVRAHFHVPINLAKPVYEKNKIGPPFHMEVTKFVCIFPGQQKSTANTIVGVVEVVGGELGCLFFWKLEIDCHLSTRKKSYCHKLVVVDRRLLHFYFYFFPSLLEPYLAT